MGFLANWILRRVVKSALVFEASSIETYRRLRDRPRGRPARGQPRPPAGGGGAPLAHPLRRGGGDVSTPPRSSRWCRTTSSAAWRDLAPLEGETRRAWGPELERALAEEEQTLLFYGNLGRMSRIPAVRRAFEVLAAMEREHVEILRRLLGAADGSSADGQADPSATPVVDSAPPGE